MEKIAIISDIHGNIPALEAVLANISLQGINSIFCLGDMVGKGPDSDKVVDICQEKCKKIILGNWDDLMLSKDIFRAAVWHQEKLGKRRLEFIKSLPNCIEFVMSGKNIRLFHASQIGVHHRVRMTDDAEKLLKMFDNTEFTGNKMNPDIVGYGDIHAPFKLNFQNKSLFNVGSVGNPLGFTDASYCILEGEMDGDKSDIFGINFIRVPYDIELTIKIATEQNMPDLDLFARELRTGIYRGNFSTKE
jgi:protein phosphatase